MVQSLRPGGADVHRRPLAYRFEAFEDFDFVCAVVVGTAAGGRGEIAVAGIVKLSIRHGFWERVEPIGLRAWSLA
jgi:hypothetical protein